MKLFAPFLFLAMCAAVAPVYGQANTDDLNNMSGIKRPAASPAPSAAAAAKMAPGPKKPLEASLSKDEKGKSVTTSFAASDPAVYLVWKDESAAKGDKIRVVWIAEDAGGMKGKRLNEKTQEATGPNSFGSFNLSAPGGGFPAGKYRAELYDGAKLARSLKFTVKK